ncbi:hypothetical protein SAY87_022801 [Trapa incisa]|uniref:Core-2/I-branching beta-1,6-N-acetylglucosaminyltransferase family protein n=1 Tax=Trapa incisa TaxID=236973 RepID=A0AAN7KAT6_9MYRT|nr:hypothetical protein SAY87_022801 [Trapa incisa]
MIFIYTPMGSADQSPILSKLKQLLTRGGFPHAQIKMDHFFDFFLLTLGLSLGIVVIYIIAFCYVSVNVPDRPISDHHRHLPRQGPPLLRPGSEQKVSRMHNMSDDELLSRAVLVRGMEFSGGDSVVPKVAFAFLTSRDVHLYPIWERFFSSHRGLYSIYWHAHPSYRDSMPVDSVFYGTRIPSQKVQWGTSSMMDAERRLLANALLDPTNQRFVLLSESCIPLFDFMTVYGYLMNTNLSFQASFDDPAWTARGRYNPKMAPTINVTEWRKGSQWFELNRDVANLVVSDRKYYRIFQEHCQPPCYVDEHYIPTLLNILRPASNSNRTVTWVDWSKDGPHPGKFGWDDMTDEFLNNIRFGSNCSYNGNVTSKCFLFGRKFLPSALEQLLRILPVLIGLDP